MKRFFLTSLLGLAAASIQAATAPGYTNYGFGPVVSTIDATNFVNYGTFSVGTGYPYTPFNTRNYLNLGIMQGSPGFRFDTAPYSAGSQRSMAASFVNGSFATSNNASISGSTHVIVSATNIVNRGLLSIGEYGLISLEGRNVDLIRGAFQAGTLTDRASLLPEAIFDSSWSFGSSAMNPDLHVVTQFPNTPAYSLTQFIPGGGPNPYVTIARTQMGLFPFGGGQLTSAEFIREVGTNRTVQIVFLLNSNPNITTEIRSVSNGEEIYSLGTPTIVWRAVGTNVFGQVVTNNLYLEDTFGLSVTNQFLTNYPYSSQPPQSVPIPPATYQPDNFSITRTVPNSFFGGLVGPSFVDKPHSFWTTNANIRPVTAEYSAYGVRIATTTTDPLQVTNQRSGPGRIEVKASGKLDMALTRIDGLNYLSLNSTNHFSGASGAAVSATYCDIALGSTNGLLDTSGLLQSTLPRFSGTIDCYSVKWTSGVSFAGNTNLVNFHVLYVDSALLEFTAPQMLDLSLRSTNLLIGDTFRVLNNLSLDTDRLTVLSNGVIDVARADINWADSATHIKSLTNLGTINVPNEVHFISRNTNGSDKPYNNFVNSGTINSYATIIASDNVENMGFISSFYGPIVIRASSNVTLHPFGNLSAPNADISIAARDLYVTNQLLQIGRSLSLSVTNSLNAGANNWGVFDGFHLLTKPVTGDLAETTITDTAFPYAEVMHSWAAADLGPVPAGFSNNAALGQLVLDGGLNSLFTFYGTGPSSNALYVDVLNLLNSAAEQDADGNLTALNVLPGMKIYYSQAFSNGVDVTSGLAGKNGGALGQVAHVGPLSVIPRFILKASDIDLKVSVVTTPQLHTVVSWNTVAGAANQLYCVDQPNGTNWVPVTNFVSTVGGRVSITEPITGSGGRFFKVRVDQP